MSDQTTTEGTQGTADGGSHEPTNAEERRVSDAVKQSHDQALSPDQKHQNYLDDLERLHSEP